MIYDVSIQQLDLSCIFDLKGSQADISSCLKELCLEPPKQPNTGTMSGKFTLGWVGPNHWLLLAPQSEEQTLMSVFDAQKTIERNISVIEVSDMFQFFSIEGPDAHDILAICSPIDSHETAFPKNGFTYTKIFDTKALLLRSIRGFHIAVDRSYADFINDNLHRTLGNPLPINHAGRVAKNNNNIS